ncbi:MAG: hypothetical protein ACM37W_02610 [Actinomycetota bacterium]
MTVAIRSTVPARRRATRTPTAASPKTKVTSVARTQAATRVPTPEQAGSAATAGVSVVKALPVLQTQPLWLRSLQGLQRTTSVITFVLLSATLSVYGLSVYSQQRWSEEYQKLETLRRNEQQLNAANEVLKHQIATAAENPDSGLTPQHPEDMIFLQPAPERPAPSREIVPNRELTPSLKPGSDAPLGY